MPPAQPNVPWHLLAQDDVMPLSIVEGVTAPSPDDHAGDGYRRRSNDGCRHVQDGGHRASAASDNDVEETNEASSASGGEARTDPRLAERRRWVSRARIRELLIERGARRTWRRDPDTSRSAHDEFRRMMQDDDGRVFCTPDC